MQLKINRVLSTELTPEFKDPNILEISSEKVYGGNFGELYSCHKIDGKKLSKPQLVKILTTEADKNFATVVEFQKRIKKANESMIINGDEILNLYPALLGVPQFSFHTVLNGQEVKGYSANDLNYLGFKQYKEIEEKNDLSEEFHYQFTFLDRFHIIYDLVRAMQFLGELKYIHADFKPDALFVNLQKRTCAIIDYDSGALLNATGLAAETTTIGTPQDWLAPELMRQTGHLKHAAIRPDIRSDQWSVTMCAFQMLFRITPYAFMAKTSDAAMKEYLNDSKWPDVIDSKDYLDEGNYELSEYIGEVLNNDLSVQMKSIFETTFSDGYFNPGRRSTYEEWLSCFGNLGDPVIIKRFEPSVEHLETKGETTLYWEVQNGKHIYLDKSNVSDVSMQIVSPNRATTYKLTAYNEFGAKTEATTFITVSDKPPIIHDFDYKAINKMANKFQLFWKLENAHRIFVYPDIGEVTKKEKIDVVGTGTYLLVAESYFGAKEEQYLVVSGLFIPNPHDSLFLSSPPNSLFNNL